MGMREWRKKHEVNGVAVDERRSRKAMYIVRSSAGGGCIHHGKMRRRNDAPFVSGYPD